jgi:ParB family chromosome partitioning protein
MSVKKRGLGRGLDALLSSVAPPSAPEAGEELRELALDQLAPGRHQPRRSFDPEALEALSESIRAQGVVQPIVVRQVSEGGYEIVAGERRWRAARMAGLKTVPAVVRAMPDRTAMAVALVENIQRADLNPLEEAEALQRLIDECGLTHEQTAEAVGRSRTAVSNLLRLLELPAEVQQLVRENKLSLGHAKVLLGVAAERQRILAEQVIARGLSVRETEKLVAAEAGRKPAEPRAARSPVETELTQRVGLPVRLTQNAHGRGKLVIGFANSGELERILRMLR